MYELVYASAARRLFNPLELAELLERARANHSLWSNGSLTDEASDTLRFLDGFRRGEWRRYVMG